MLVTRPEVNAGPMERSRRLAMGSPPFLRPPFSSRFPSASLFSVFSAFLEVFGASVEAWPTTSASETRSMFVTVRTPSVGMNCLRAFMEDRDSPANRQRRRSSLGGVFLFAFFPFRIVRVFLFALGDLDAKGSDGLVVNV